MTNPQRRWLEDAFVNPEDVDPMPGSLSGKDIETYDRLALASRMGSDEPSDFEFAVGEAIFLNALDDMLKEGETAEKPASKGAHRRPWIMLVAAVFIGGLTAVIVSNIQQKSEDEFQARGAVSPQEYRYAPTEILAFCVKREGGEIEFKSLATDPRCGIDDELKLAYVAPDSNLRYGHFLGVSESGEIFWYGPSPAEADPTILAHTLEPTPVGETVRLAVNHKPGKVTVVAMFTEDKLSWGTYENWVNTSVLPQVSRGELPQTFDRASLSVAYFEVVETE